jgi:hypothetical protein
MISNGLFVTDCSHALNCFKMGLQLYFWNFVMVYDLMEELWLLFYRDVKASSILLDDKFEVRLGSLSDARVQDGDPHPSRITRLLGLSQ